MIAAERILSTGRQDVSLFSTVLQALPVVLLDDSRLLPMDKVKLIEETIATYRQHNWRLARVLLTDQTLALVNAAAAYFGDAVVRESPVDAMWFTRPSSGGREAWELRLLSESPYALFELFEEDEAEEDREDVRREMEARLRDIAERG